MSLIINYYFSEKNVLKVNKLRSSYEYEHAIKNKDLPILKNDTSDIFINKNDLEEFKSKRKKRFWEKLISRENE